MRLLIGVALVTLAAASPVHARVFRQTYGATVASPTGGGCAWNLDSDYFVPRTCDSCRYDLFSACKTHHSVSPACRNLHPVYCGYCTPYGECHYKWRDHIYKKYCGCTPLRCTYGPWELDKCRKHCLVLRDGGCSACGGPPVGDRGLSGGEFCGGGCGLCANYPPVVDRGLSDGYFGGASFYAGGELPNVEPLSGEALGAVLALPPGMGGVGSSSGGTPTTVGPGAPPSPAMSAVLGSGATSLSPTAYGN